MKEFNFLSILTKIIHTPEEIQELKNQFSHLKGQLQKQEDFFQYCLEWKLAPWIYAQMVKMDLIKYLENDILKKFEEYHLKIFTENTERNNKAKQFLEEFSKNGIEVIILKGNLFAQTFYQDIGYKKMNDFDILVHQEDWDKIQDIYLKLDYIPMGFGWSGEKEKPTKFSHTGIPFISNDFKCIIGTQWGIKSPTAGYTVDMKEVWETALEFDFYGIKCKQLSPEYNLLHLILHMGIYKCGIRDCMDVYNLMLHQPMDENKLVTLFKKSNATEKAAFTLQISQLCSNSIPVTLLTKLPMKKNSFLFKRWMNRKKMFDETQNIHTSYNDHFQDIEKNVLYFNIFTLYHDKFGYYSKILQNIYFPSQKRALQFIDKSHAPNWKNRVHARLVAPHFSFSLIAQEIGWKITFLLFIKLFSDLLISPINYVFIKETYFDYLEKKGIHPKNIKKAVANVQ